MSTEADAARSWLTEHGEGEQAAIASNSEVFEMIASSYPGGKRRFRENLKSGNLAEGSVTGWSSGVEAERFNLSIALGGDAMGSRDELAEALRGAADAVQATVVDEGGIPSDNGDKVGWWAFEDDPRECDGNCFAFRGQLEVYAESEEEARELAEELSRFVAEPVLFGCAVDVGGDIAPPALKLPAVHDCREGV